MPSRKSPSLKFSANQAARSTVWSSGAARSRASLATAPSSPRPESSTTWRTPAAAAAAAKAAMSSAACGTARSGW